MYKLYSVNNIRFITYLLTILICKCDIIYFNVFSGSHYFSNSVIHSILCLSKQ